MPNKPKHTTRVSEGGKRKHIAAETPCDAGATAAGYGDDSK